MNDEPEILAKLQVIFPDLTKGQFDAVIEIIEQEREKYFKDGQNNVLEAGIP